MSTGPGGALRTSVSRSGDQAVVRLTGELDIATEARLRARLRDLLEPERAQPVRELVVDARQLSFVDLAGLRLLLECDRDLRARGGRLVLRAPSRRVRRLLHVVGVEGLAVEP